MNPQDAPEPKQDRLPTEVVQHVAQAHGLLKNLQEKLDEHPELDQAIEKLEMALSVLTTQSGGLL